MGGVADEDVDISHGEEGTGEDAGEVTIEGVDAGTDEGEDDEVERTLGVAVHASARKNSYCAHCALTLLGLFFLDLLFSIPGFTLLLYPLICCEHRSRCHSCCATPFAYVFSLFPHIYSTCT